MYSGLAGLLEGRRALCPNLSVGFEAVWGALMYETLGFGFAEVGLDGGSVQWLMMVEFVFDFSLIGAQGVSKCGVSTEGT